MRPSYEIRFTIIYRQGKKEQYVLLTRLMSLALALRDPVRAASNACNYEYFSVDAFNNLPQEDFGHEVPAQEVLV